jgi:branched-chain amino acid transport system substrate-binding protein
MLAHFIRTRHLITIACVALLGCSRPAPEPMNIGHLTLRGLPERTLAESTDNAVLLAVEEIKDQPPIPDRPVTVINPEATSADSLPAVATRLITVNRALALLADTRAAPTEQLCRVAQQYNLPLVTSCGLPGSALAPFAFSVGLAPAEQGKYLARFAIDDKKVRDLVLLVDTRLLLSQPLASAFSDEFRKTEGANIATWTFGADAELLKLVEKLKDKPPAAVAFVGAVEDLPKLRGPKGLAPDVPVFFGGEEAPPAPGADADGELYQATAFVSDGSSPRAQEFVKSYETRFKQPATVSAALAYDAARVLFEGLRRAKSAQGAKVQEELRKLKGYESLTGPLSFDKDHNTHRPVFIVQRARDGWKLQKRYEPETKE